MVLMALKRGAGGAGLRPSAAPPPGRSPSGSRARGPRGRGTTAGTPPGPQSPAQRS